MRSLTVLIALAASVASASADNFPHIKTGGFDYDENTIRTNTAEAQWLATHHDMIIGAQPHGSGTTFDKMREETFDLLRRYNPQVKIVGYVPFQTMLQWMSLWMENYARNNGLNPEDLYCHYEVDTRVLLRNGQTVTFKGYPRGTATSRATSRVPSSWWSGTLPNVCPVSPTFRRVYTELIKESVTMNAASRKYLDGVFLDTFEGSVDTYYKLYLENTVEMRALGKTTYAAAQQQMVSDMITTRNQLESALQTLTGRAPIVMANGADIDNFYQWYTDVYSTKYTSTYNEFGIEFLLTSSLSSTARIARLKQTYDDLAHSTRPITYFVNSQTNNNTGVTHPFTQFILATHYLINHPKAYFSYHVGSAANYGTLNGSFRNSHWHRNIEYNIGTPATRTGTDYWGASNTNRFYMFADGGSTNKVLAREYTNALVLAKFGPGGWSNIGLSRQSYTLPGRYRLLNADNTLGPVITSISLGYQEGAILIKDGAPSGGGNTGGTNTPPGVVRNNARSDAR